MFCQQYTDDLNTAFIRATTEAYRQRCMSKASMDTNTTAVNDVRAVACENSCSGNGDCVNGELCFFYKGQIYFIA